jgi:hypothetical protein
MSASTSASASTFASASASWAASAMRLGGVSHVPSGAVVWSGASPKKARSLRALAAWLGLPALLVAFPSGFWSVAVGPSPAACLAYARRAGGRVAG